MKYRLKENIISAIGMITALIFGILFREEEIGTSNVLFLLSFGCLVIIISSFLMYRNLDKYRKKLIKKYESYLEDPENNNFTFKSITYTKARNILYEGGDPYKIVEWVNEMIRLNNQYKFEGENYEN